MFLQQGFEKGVLHHLDPDCEKAPSLKPGSNALKKSPMSQKSKGEIGLLAGLDVYKELRIISSGSLKINGSANQKDTRLPHSVRKDRLSRSKVLGEHSTVKRLCTSIEKSFNVGTSQIEGLTKKKQSRHDFSLEIFSKSVVDICEDAEVLVIEAGRNLRDKLNSIDFEIEKILQELAKPEKLCEKDYEFLVSSLENLLISCDQRGHEVKTFGDFLTSIEENRGACTGKSLMNLFHELLKASHITFGEVCRLIEEKSVESNYAMIANLKSNAILISKLRLGQLNLYHSVRALWNEAEIEWRKLRHNLSVDRWIQVMDSARFSRPPQRHESIQECILKISDRHLNGRKMYLQRIENLAIAEAHIEENNVWNLFQKLHKLDTEDLFDYEACLNKIHDFTNQVDENMFEMREKLRFDLHLFSSFTNKRGLYTKDVHQLGSVLKSDLVCAMHKKENESVFRKLPSMKAELSQIANKLETKDLVYDKNLRKIHSRVTIFNTSNQLAKLLDMQGKSDVFKCMDVLCEKVRTSRKADAHLLLDEILNALSRISNVIGIPETLSDFIKESQRGIHILRSSLEGDTSVRNDSASFPFHPQASNLGDKPTFMQEMRVLFRQILPIIYFPRLGSAMKSNLLNVEKLLDFQKQANLKVDKEIKGLCDKKMQQKIADQRKSDVILRRALMNRSINIFRGCEGLGIFFCETSRILQNKKKEEFRLDSKIDSSLDVLAESHASNDCEREKVFASFRQRLRLASDRISLELSMVHALDLLEDIQTGYRTYYREATELCKSHCIGVNDIKEVYLHHLCRLFQVKIANDDILFEDDIADAFDFASYWKREEHSANTKPVRQTDYLMTKYLQSVLPSSGCSDGNEILPMPSGISFTTTASENEIAESLMRLPMQACVSKILSGVNSSRMMFVHCEKYSTETPIATQDDASNLNDLREAMQATSTVADPSWSSMMLLHSKLFLERKTIAACVEKLRTNTLRNVDNLDTSRHFRVKQLSRERQDDLMEELEEKLRLHWPRKGRTVVKFMQPRSGELLYHKQRHERHVRSVLLKNSNHDFSFNAHINEFILLTRAYSRKMKNFTAVLKEKTNLASLQGVLRGAKLESNLYNKDAEVLRSVLMKFVKDEPRTLIELGRIFLASCLTFANGGDYNEDEIQLERESLNKIDTVVLESVQERALEVKRIFAVEKLAWVHLNTFQSSYEECIVQLSIKEGLGRKFGAPRRNAQEKLRSEISKSENAILFFEEKSTELLKLCESEDDFSGSDGKTSHINVLLQTLRVCSHRISHYLSFSKINIQDDPMLNGILMEEEPLSSPACMYQDEYNKFLGMKSHGKIQHIHEIFSDVSKFLHPTNSVNGEKKKDGVTKPHQYLETFSVKNDECFLDAMRHAEDICIKETKELYAQQGLECALPDSLHMFLKEQMEKAKVQQINASKRFRSNLKTLMGHLCQVPEIVLQDILGKTRLDILNFVNSAKDTFEAELSNLNRLQEKHKRLLRPQLGYESKKGELDALCSSEKQRIGVLERQIGKTSELLYSRLENSFFSFVRHLLHWYYLLMKSLDLFVYPSDLLSLPGDEVEEAKRQSLKELHKIRARCTKINSLHKKSRSFSEVRMPVRIWCGLPLKSFDNMLTSLKFYDAQGMVSTDSVNANTSPKTEVLTLPFASYFTEQHRMVVNARDKAYKEFLDFYSNLTCALSDYFRGANEEKVSGISF